MESVSSVTCFILKRKITKWRWRKMKMIECWRSTSTNFYRACQKESSLQRKRLHFCVRFSGWNLTRLKSLSITLRKPISDLFNIPIYKIHRGDCSLWEKPRLNSKSTALLLSLSWTCQRTNFQKRGSAITSKRHTSTLLITTSAFP